MTPVSRPEITAPGRAAAGTAGKVPVMDGDAGLDPAGEERTAWEKEGVANGVAATDGAGDAASTTHMR